jgi:hypothetical protein
VSGTSNYIYANPTNDLRGLQKAATPSTRIEAGLFNYVFGQTTTSFTVEVKLPSSSAGERVSFYVQDWDGGGRAETITALDGQTGATLDTQSVSNFRNGVYLSWDQQGDIVYRFTKTAGPSAEVSAMFFGGASAAPPAGGAATFVKSDSTTNGNWQNVYGTDGYNIYGLTPKPPTYGTLSSYGDSVGTYTFATPPISDPRGLQNPSGGRVAVAQYSTTSFTLDVNLTDGLTHQVTLYAVDWDNVGRSEKFEVIDNTTGTVYDTETLSNFATTGVYLSWNVSGHVQIRVTSTSSAGQTAVVQGVFFDPDPPVMGAAAIAPLTTSTVVTTGGTQGSTSNAVTFPGQGLMNGVDVVLLDRLFANGKHLQGPDFGVLGLTGGIG